MTLQRQLRRQECQRAQRSEESRGESLGSPQMTWVIINCDPKEVLDVLERTGKFYVQDASVLPAEFWELALELCQYVNCKARLWWGGGHWRRVANYSLTTSLDLMLGFEPFLRGPCCRYRRFVAHIAARSYVIVIAPAAVWRDSWS